MLRVLIIVVAAALASGLSACRPRAPVADSVVLWAMGREGELVRGLLPEFERRTGVQVTVQQIPWGAAHEKLLTAYVGDALPDVFQVGNTWIPELAALGAVEPVDDWMAGSSVVARDDYFPGILDTNVIDGATYGVPWYVDTRLLFLRSDLLAEVGVTQPPATWAAWLDAMLRLQQRPGTQGYAILLPFNEWQLPVILAMQRGASLLRDHDCYGNFRSAEFRSGFDFYLQLFARGLAPRGGEAQAANIYQDFAAGYFGFYVTGPWNLGEFRARLPAALQSHWTTAPMPAPSAGTPGVSVAGGSSLVLSAASPRRAAAWKLIEYLSEVPTQQQFYALGGDLPSRRSAWEGAALAGNEQAQAFARQLSFVRSTPKIPEWERIASRIAQYAEAAARQTMTVDAALAALDADTDTILEKRRWLVARAESRR